jgi:hypothetical protein
VVPLPGLWPQGSTSIPLRSCLGIEDHFVLSEGSSLIPGGMCLSAQCYQFGNCQLSFFATILFLLTTFHSSLGAFLLLQWLVSSLSLNFSRDKQPFVDSEVFCHPELIYVGFEGLPTQK